MQADIIDGMSLFSLPDDVPATDDLEDESIHWIARVIVMTQSCDLVQGKGRRIVVAPVHVAREFVEKGLIRESVVRDQIRRHLMFGWYFLPANTTPVEIPESLIDLRDLHTVPFALLT